MQYRFHHIGLLSKDAAETADFYCAHFAHEPGPSAELPVVGPVKFIRGTTDVAFGIFDTPLDALPAELVEKGVGVAYIALSVPDLDAATSDLLEKGAKVVWDRATTDFGESAGFFCGLYDLLVVLVQPAAELQAQLPPVGVVGDLRSHHTAVVTRDLGGVVHMFETWFGFRVLAEWVFHGAGEIKLVDPFYNDTDHYFLIEVLNPPQVAQSDQEVLDRRGTTRASRRARIRSTTSNSMPPSRSCGIRTTTPSRCTGTATSP